MRTLSSTEAKARLNAVLAEIERTGEEITITTHGRPVAVLRPVAPPPRRFGQFPAMVVPDDFDAPQSADDLERWESGS